MRISKKNKEKIKGGLQGHFIKRWDPFLEREVQEFVSHAKNNSIIKQEREREEELLRMKKEYEKVYQELRENGYASPDSEEWHHYLAKYKLFDNKYIQILLKWLPQLNDKSIALSLLHYSKNKFDGKILTKLFELDKDRKYRWEICELIDFVLPVNIDEWIVKAFLNQEYGKTTEMLGLTISKLFPYQKASEILCKGFFLHPIHSAKALGEIGKDKEVIFLNKNKNRFDKYTQKEITKAIQKIIKRVGQRKP